MSYDFEPWSKYPPLTAERLSVIADLIRRVRRDAVRLHDPAAGDSEWSLGCRVYARTCHALEQAAYEYDWLRILPDGQSLAFTFAIASIPIKFYHGEAGDTPDRYRIVSGAERHQQQLALRLDGIQLEGQKLRLAVETDNTREVATVTLVETDGQDNLTATYVIPFEVEADQRVVPLLAPAVDVPAPRIEPLAETEKRRERDVR